MLFQTSSPAIFQRNKVSAPEGVAVYEPVYELIRITSLSLDHSDILGDTIEKISKEKAGIIKKDTPIYIFEQNENIIEIIKKKSAKVNAPLTIIKSNDVETFTSNDLGSVFKYKGYNIKLPLIGGHQVQNCVLAIDICLLYTSPSPRDRG